MPLQKTYAQIAAHTTRQQNIALGATIAQKKKKKEINIKINKPSQQYTKRTSGNIIKDIKQVISNKIIKKALALRKLPNRDLIL